MANTLTTLLTMMALCMSAGAYDINNQWDLDTNATGYRTDTTEFSCATGPITWTVGTVQTGMPVSTTISDADMLSCVRSCSLNAAGTECHPLWLCTNPQQTTPPPPNNITTP